MISVLFITCCNNLHLKSVMMCNLWYRADFLGVDVQALPHVFTFVLHSERVDSVPGEHELPSLTACG